MVEEPQTSSPLSHLSVDAQVSSGFADIGAVLLYFLEESKDNKGIWYVPPSHLFMLQLFRDSVQ